MSLIQWKIPRTNDARVDAVLHDLCNRLRRRFDEVDAALALKAPLTTTSTSSPATATFHVPDVSANYVP